MTEPSPRNLPADAAARVHPLRGGVYQCVSPSAVLRRIGQETGHLPARQRPSDADRRAAAALAAGLNEIVEEQWGREGEPWRVEVPHSEGEIARRTGTTAGEAEAALQLLIQTGLVVAVRTGGERRLRLGEPVFEELPALARIKGPSARARLEMIGASLMPAQAVLRELAVASGSYISEDEPGPWLTLSLARLSELTLFRRTAVSRALGDLEDAGLLERAARSGKRHSYRLLPSIFGVEHPSVRTGTPTRPGEAAANAPLRSAHVSPGGESSATGAMVEIGGVRFRIDAGVECDVQVDSSGTPFLRFRRGER